MPRKLFRDRVEIVISLEREERDLALALAINLSQSARAGIQSAIGREIQHSDRVDKGCVDAYIATLKERADRDRSLFEGLIKHYRGIEDQDKTQADQGDRIISALVSLPASYRYPGFLFKRLPDISGSTYADMWDEIRGYVTAQLNEEVDLSIIYSVVKKKGYQGVF